MIDFLSSLAMNYLNKYNLIEQSKDEYDHYKYGIEITISSLINLLLVFSIGIMINRIMYSLIFLTIFISLRQITGGFHAKTYLRCNITMCCSFAIVVLGTTILQSLPLFIFIIHILLSILIEYKLCPVENINKPIEPKCIPKFKIASIIISSFISSIGLIIMNSTDYPEYGMCIIMTIIIINILVIVSQIEKG
ncbi:accessory gene regulator B [Ruminococcus flavefaciens]|uniref:Accessory gene regulator B n=2 Tax=Ruminococcus flavefaciens TaxID=1265 RepID=A0A315XZ64_RUMFL|nr:accessory gene regulator B [Ruminococcus flavefaciens]SSA50212.1 accessory gene regulator B [Ruminococcus flavefaciens]